jgi:hypothetical protein
MPDPVLTSAAPPRHTARPVRAWRHFHPATLLIGLALQGYLGYLLLFDHVNPVPDAGQLVQLPVEVLQVQERSPQLLVRLVDDTQRALEFPGSAALLARTHTPLQAGEWEKLPGCMGYALGVAVRGGDDARFRIWELHCGAVHRRLDEFRQAYEVTAREAQRAMQWHGAANLLLTLAALVLEHRAMRRGGRA